MNGIGGTTFFAQWYRACWLEHLHSQSPERSFRELQAKLLSILLQAERDYRAPEQRVASTTTNDLVLVLSNFIHEMDCRSQAPFLAAGDVVTCLTEDAFDRHACDPIRPKRYAGDGETANEVENARYMLLIEEAYDAIVGRKHAAAVELERRGIEPVCIRLVDSHPEVSAQREFADFPRSSYLSSSRPTIERDPTGYRYLCLTEQEALAVAEAACDVDRYGAEIEYLFGLKSVRPTILNLLSQPAFRELGIEYRPFEWAVEGWTEDDIPF